MAPCSHALARMHERRRAVAAALSFLTVVPIGRRLDVGEHDLRRGAVLFPAVGAAIGLVVAAVTWGVDRVLPPLAAGALGVATGVVVTAALHLDGLADVADGVGASLVGRDPVPAMRDARLGTFGVTTVVLDLVLKVSLVSALAVDGFPWAIPAAAALARAAPVALAWRLPYVGTGTGGWTDRVRGRMATVAVVVALGVAVAALGPARAAFAAVAVGLVIVVVGRWSLRILGGVTGDVFGAATELGETLALGAALAVR